MPVNLWQSGGLAAVVVGVIWMVLTGRLVPRSQIKDLIKDRDLWKEAYWRTQAVNDAQTSQVQKLMDTIETTNRVLKAIPPTPDEEDTDETPAKVR